MNGNYTGVHFVIFGPIHEKTFYWCQVRLMLAAKIINQCYVVVIRRIITENVVPEGLETPNA